MEASSEKKALFSTFGPKLRQERQRHHLSQEKLAEMVGCDARSIRRWEQGKGFPDYENRHRLSKALDITLEDFTQLLQPVEERDDQPLENDMLDIALEDFTQFIQPVEKENDQPLESDIQVSLHDNSSTSFGSEVHSKHLVQHQQRRALLQWGGIALAATLVGGVCWLSGRSPSSPSSPSSTLSNSLSSSQRLPPSLVYTFTAPTGVAIRAVKWSPSDDFIVCVDANNHAQVFTISSTYDPSRTGSIYAPSTSQTHYAPSKTGFAVNCITWSPNGIQLASPAINHNMIHIWDPKDSVDTHFPYAFSAPEDIAWSYDGLNIATCGANGLVSTWNAMNGSLTQRYSGHTGTVWQVAWSPDNIYLATAGSDGTVRIWDTAQDQLLLIYRGHRNAVFDVKWSPDGESIVSASQDTTVQIWNARTGIKKSTYVEHAMSVRVAEWSPDGRFIASAGADATVRIWDASTRKTYVTYSDHTSTIRALSWSPSEVHPYLASASEDGTMRVWNVNL